MTLKDEDSDIQATLSDAPPDWNSDDEPPDDHVGDENTCSRDGAVRKVIKKVGKGLERPGQNDIVTLSFFYFPTGWLWLPSQYAKYNCWDGRQ